MEIQVDIIKEHIPHIFIRICKDSGYKIDYIQAGYMTAKTLGIHPLEVAARLGLNNMQKIAKGEHPACNDAKYETH